jgi:ParB family chromosome partitioning protein
MMTQATASASDRRARFVGEDAYVAAGGRIERDLFSDEADARWLDVALLERLASEKLEALAGETAAEQGLSFVRPSLDSWIGHAQTEGLRRVPLATPALTGAEAIRVELLEGEMEALARGLEDETLGHEERARAETDIARLSDEIDAILSKPPQIDEALRSQVGAFLILDDQGRPKLDTTYYLPDRGDGGEQVTGASAGAGTEDALEAAGKGVLSQRLTDELAMQRRDILAVHVAADPGFALDLGIFLMIDRGEGLRHERSGSSLSARPPLDPITGFETPGTAASIARAEAGEALDRSWMAGDTSAERFDAFRALSEDSRAAWLGHAIASTLEASLACSGERACPFHDHLGTLLGIEAARWWRPTGANYFDRVPKNVTFAALAEIGGPALADRYAKAKKAELAQACERIFSGDFIADVEVKEAALKWVPAEMRFSSTEPPSPADAATDLGHAPVDANAVDAVAHDVQPEQIEEAA